jgi:protein TonB
MSVVSSSQAKPQGLWNYSPDTRIPAVERPAGIVPEQRTVSDGGSVLLGIFTTSLCLHFLIVGILGGHLPKEAAAPREIPAPAPTRLIEDVKIEAEKIPPPPVNRERILDEPLPAPAAKVDLPPIPQVRPITAVAAGVAVDFALRVTGPVTLVSSSAEASGFVGVAPSGPVEIDEATSGRNLLIPVLQYPPKALLHRETGRVQVEFRTSATGDISEAKLRRSSGSDDLDQAALDNLRQGRWTGEAGYFTKTYEFILR